MRSIRHTFSCRTCVQREARVVFVIFDDKSDKTTFVISSVNDLMNDNVVFEILRT